MSTEQAFRTVGGEHIHIIHITAHFVDEEHPGRTLCGESWDAILWRNDLRADCIRCREVWLKRTDWAFPLPQLGVS